MARRPGNHHRHLAAHHRRRWPACCSCGHAGMSTRLASSSWQVHAHWAPELPAPNESLRAGAWARSVSPARCAAQGRVRPPAPAAPGAWGRPRGWGTVAGMWDQEPPHVGVRGRQACAVGRRARPQPSRWCRRRRAWSPPPPAAGAELGHLRPKQAPWCRWRCCNQGTMMRMGRAGKADYDLAPASAASGATVIGTRGMVRSSTAVCRMRIGGSGAQYGAQAAAFAAQLGLDLLVVRAARRPPSPAGAQAMAMPSCCSSRSQAHNSASVSAAPRAAPRRRSCARSQAAVGHAPPATLGDRRMRGDQVLPPRRPRC